MSTQHRPIDFTMKKIKLNEVDENVSSVGEYKNKAFLQYCNGNDIEKHQLNEMSTSNNLLKSGLFCYINNFFLYF